MIIGLILKKQEDRRTADRELLYSTSLATAALESTHDGILIVDLEGKIARWNNIFVELWHVPQHLLDMTVKDPVLSYVCSQMENPDEFLAKVLELYNCPDKTSTDLLHLADGRIFERYSQPQRVGNEIVGRFWSFHDITERRISEQKLLDEREFSNVALNSLPGVFYIIGPDNRFLRWNDNFENVCEYSSEEFSQISPLDLFEGNDKNLIRARIEEVFVKGVSDAEAEIVTRSGKHIPYYFTGRTIKVDGVACLIGMGIDITERKKKDEALAESEESYRNLFNLATDGIFILDSEGNFIDANKTAYERLGYTRDELLSLHISELDHPDFAINAPRRLQQVVDQYSAIFESGHMRKDGSMMPVEVNSRLLEYKGQQVYFSVIRDITERKCLEEEQQSLEKQLLHAQKLESLGVLAGGIAHDFNNILTAIIGNAELALLRINKESPGVDNLQKIEEAAARAADLAKQMLAYSISKSRVSL